MTTADPAGHAGRSSSSNPSTLGGADSSTGPIRRRRPNRAAPSATPENAPGGPESHISRPTHTQDLISTDLGHPMNPVGNQALPPVLSDDDIDSWMGSSGGKELPNLREERFCHEYLTDYNVRKAMERAGYAPSTINQGVSLMMRRPHIVARVKEIQDGMMRNLGITQERVLAELAAIGFARVSDVVEVTPGGKLRVKELSDLRDDQIAAIDEIKCDPETGEIVTVKMHGKMPALEMLGKNLRMWDKDENKKRGTTFNLNVSIGGGGEPAAPFIEGTVEGGDDQP